MNILMVHPHDLFHKSEPWTIRIESIAREFAEKNHNVRLCYSPLSANSAHYPDRIGSIELTPLSRSPSPMAFIGNLTELIGLCRWADLVHFQKCHHYTSIPAVLAGYISGKPLHYDWDDWEEKIYYESCGKSVKTTLVGFSYRIFERVLPLLVDSVSCASSYLKELAKGFGVDHEYVFDSPVGADLVKFRPGLNGNEIRKKYGIGGDLVLYVGQLHGAQYADLFLHAAYLVLKVMPDVRFMIVGEGFLEHELKKRMGSLGIEKNVVFTGSVSHDEVPYYMAAASICVASFKDTEVTRCKSPLKIVEYLASGKPIVSSDIREARRMVEGAGVLVRPDDSHSLADGMMKLLKDKDLREDLGRFAREKAEKEYNWPRTASSLITAYEKIT